MSLPLPPPARAAWPRSTAERLAGDASSRTYYRLRGVLGSVLVVVYPPDAVVRLARDLEVLRRAASVGVRVPAVVCEGPTWAVLEDLGTEDAEESLRRMPPSQREAQAERLARPLVHLARMAPDRVPSWNLPLDGRRLREELHVFEGWFLDRASGLPPDSAVGAWLDRLADALDHHPRRPCHRDYHLNNLFLLDDGEVGVIDIQDLPLGPDTYDLASLLYDRAAPRLLGERFAARFLGHWEAATTPAEGCRERLAWTRLQRGLKVLGTFARLGARGRTGYHGWLRELAADLGRPLAAGGAPERLLRAVRRAGGV